MSYISTVRPNPVGGYFPATNTAPLNRHLDEFSFAFSDGWNGRGAKALTQQIVDKCNRLLHEVSAPDPVEVTPGKSGSLSFVWEDTNGTYVYCEVGPGDLLHVFYKIVRHERPDKWELISTLSDNDTILKLKSALLNLHLRDEEHRAPLLMPNKHPSPYTLSFRLSLKTPA